MRKIYIAGKISGLPLNEVVIKFGNYSQQILEQGFIPINPIDLHLCNECNIESNFYCDNCENTGIIKRTHAEYMKIDINAFLDADEIHMLPDWKDSKGAKIEHQLALDLGINIVYVDESTKPKKN